MTLPPLPEPDTHCFDDDVGKDVWSHSPEQLHAYGEACAAAYKADAERWRYINTKNNIGRREDLDEPYSLLCVVLPYGADLSCRATREEAIDAAIRAQVTAEPQAEPSACGTSTATIRATKCRPCRRPRSLPAKC